MKKLNKTQVEGRRDQMKILSKQNVPFSENK